MRIVRNRSHLNVIRTTSDNPSKASQGRRDRVALEVNQLDEVLVRSTATGNQYRDFTEFRLRVEKTFLNNRMSAEVILPWADSFDNQFAFPTIDRQVEFGNLGLGLKGVLLKSESMTLSAGVLAELPTADDYTDGTSGIRVDESSWYFTPYLATLIQPTERLFFHGFASYRMPTSDERFITLGSELAGRQPNLLSLDGSVGYYAYRGSGFISAIVPTFEVHYYSTTEKEKPDGLFTTQQYGHTDDLNLTFGVTAIMANRATLAAAYVMPTRATTFNGFGGLQNHATDQRYDGMLMFQLNLFRK